MSTNIRHLIPPSASKDTGSASAELMRAVMIRSNFMPGIRHRLGWRGVQEIIAEQSDTLAITARIADMSGVYGVHLTQRNDHGACFSLCYFPLQEDPLVESFSLQAGILAFQPDFMDRVRRFSRYDDMCALFQTGTVHIRFDPATDRCLLTLQSPKTILTIAEEGIFQDTEHGRKYLIAPGHPDQNLPALAIAMPFFRVLASSFGCTQNAIPDLLMRQSFPGCKILHVGNSTQQPILADECTHTRLLLGFGTKGSLPPDMISEKEPDLVWKYPDTHPQEYADEPWWDVPSSNDTAPLNLRSCTDAPKPRLIILTGFLGSGKTSFLDRFIEQQTGANAFVAVVQNEIGAKGLDGKIMDNNYAVTEMDEGCVCCTLAGNLRVAVQDILAQYDPDFIVLETTGVANPANLLREVYDLEDILEFGSITTLVDAVGGHETLQEFEVARSQIRLADTIMLNKCDLVETSMLAPLEEEIRSLNPVARVHRTIHGNIRANLLYGVNLHAMTPQMPSLQKMPPDGATHQKDHINTRCLTLGNALNTALLLDTLHHLQAGILRVKGIIDLQEESSPVIFQYSPGVYSIEPAPEDIGPERFLVVIGQDIHELDLDVLTG